MSFVVGKRGTNPRESADLFILVLANGLTRRLPPEVAALPPSVALVKRTHSRRSRSGSATRRSLSRGREVPEGEALRAALVFGEPEAPEGAQTVVWPRRFHSSPSLGIHCPFCGQRKAKRHRTLENCEEYQANKKKYRALGLVLASSKSAPTPTVGLLAPTRSRFAHGYIPCAWSAASVDTPLGKSATKTIWLYRWHITTVLGRAT